MAKISQLKDPNTKENIYPVTTTDGIYLPDGTPLTSYLNKNHYPIGAIIQSTCKQRNSGLHLADGAELAVGGSYNHFCQYIITNQADLGAVFDDLEARKSEFISLHNELRTLLGKEQREYK